MPRKAKKERDHDALRKKIMEDLLDQLERCGTVGTYYTDMVTDYMKLWDTKNRLIADIEDRGVIVSSVSQSIVNNIKKAGPISELVEQNSKMLEMASEENKSSEKYKALVALVKANAEMVALLHDSAITTKKNDSVGDLLKTNAQMLKLLDSLGIRPAQTDGDEDAEM
nr:MAG TPA: terminase small subunit [Caudoviricetes sp.]